MVIEKYIIDKVKDAANIVDVVGDFVELRHRGPNYEGLCPFHEDRHLGNFYVSPRRNICKCFACDCGGDGALGPVDFLMKIERLSFIDAIKWLGHKYGIEVEGSDTFADRVRQCKPRAPLPPLQMLTLPLGYVAQYGKTVDKDILCQWLCSLQWNNEQRERVPEMITAYGIGKSKDGHTIFWQVDEDCKVRTGKMMMYKADGHRDKRCNPTWVHSILKDTGHLDMTDKEMVQTLFGMHLLKAYPKARVNIVESEKTALICAIAYGNDDNDIWMACGGKQNLTSSKLKPIMEAGREILLFPDMDGIAEWEERCDLMGYDKMHVAKDFMRKNWTMADGPKADIADILVRMLGEDKDKVLQDIIKEKPALGRLIDRLNLEIV